MSTKFYEMTLERDRMEFGLGDTIDVKAGITVAIIAALGTLSGTLLTASGALPKWELISQLISIGCLLVACFLAVCAVIPRNYMLAATPENFQNWVSSLRQHYVDNPDPSLDIDSIVDDNLVSLAAKRVEANHAINVSKSRLIEWAIWPVAFALIVDVGTLSVLGVLKALS
jgi:hypothetical protein